MLSLLDQIAVISDIVKNILGYGPSSWDGDCRLISSEEFISDNRMLVVSGDKREKCLHGGVQGWRLSMILDLTVKTNLKYALAGAHGQLSLTA